MSAQIVNSHRYKKITRNSKEKKNKEAKKSSYQYNKAKLKEIKTKKKLLSQKQSSYQKGSKNEETMRSNGNKKKNIYHMKKRRYLPTVLKVGCVILAIFAIGVTSKLIVKKENETVVSVDSNPQKKVTLLQEYDFKIGMSKLDTMNYMNSKNVILNELFTKANLSLIHVNKDYSISYEVAKNIEKITNKEYVVTLNPSFGITADDVSASITELVNAGDANIYYKSLASIAHISKIEEYEFKLTLKAENPYFLYELDFPLVSKNKEAPYTISSKSDANIEFSKNKSNATLRTITFSNYVDSDNMVDDFRENKIDMFTATSDSVIQLIGKHEYNMKKYRDGQTLFLLGNKESKLFSRKEVRQALVYSLNRDEIVKKINHTFAEVIDLPYIYSDVKYKYDVFGVQNALQSQGWKKTGAIYKKEIEQQMVSLELTLIVNELDATKVKAAEMIKEMAEENGIKITIEKLKDKALQEAIAAKKYDIILADVYVSDTPDITYLQEYLNINDTITSAINIVNASTIEQLPKNIASLQEVLSSEIACIGIMARDTNVIYQKNINGFQSIGYQKVFENLENIGKIQDIKSDVPDAK